MTEDPFSIRDYYRPLRVVDVVDALDGMGYFNIGLVSGDIRPLWEGMKFWGVAFTVRCVPANRPMWQLETTEDIVGAHGIWFNETGHVRYAEQIRPGHVIVTDTGSTGEVGFWGSANAMGMVERGAVGIVTDGHCRDSAELKLQKTPICSRAVGRTIIPGRIEVVEVQTPVGIGGAQARPGDLVGCDDDGIVVVPLEVARQAADHAKAVLIADMRAREKHYQRLGLPPDETVDWQGIERYYAELDNQEGSG